MRSPRAAALRFQIGIAKSAYPRATEMPNPTIFFDNGYKAEFTYRYGVTIPMEPPWKLALRLIAAKRQVRGADLEIARSLWLLRGDIRRSYTELVVAQETYETLSELAELSKRLQDVSQKRYQAGDVPELDVLKARLANSQAEIERDVGSRRVVQARQQLAIMLGRPFETDVEVPRLPAFKLRAERIDLLPNFDEQVPTLASLLETAKKNRLEFKIVRQAILTNKANLKTAIGNILPNPIMGVGSSVVNGPRQIISNDPNNTDPPAPNHFKGFFMQGYQELPLLTFQQGDISQYRASIKQLQEEMKSQENIITGEVSAAYQRVLAARQQIQVYQEKLLNDSAEVARLARRSYEVGQSDITATLAAQQANIQVRSQYLSAVNAYQIAFTDLEQSIGTTLQ